MKTFISGTGGESRPLPDETPRKRRPDPLEWHRIWCAPGDLLEFLLAARRGEGTTLLRHLPRLQEGIGPHRSGD